MAIRKIGRRHVINILILGLASLAAVICALQGPDTSLGRDDETARGYLPYHQLKSEDFPINDEMNPGTRIYTAGFFHYDYKYQCRKENDRFLAHVTDWKVRSGFNRNKSSRKSWFTPTTRDLLHEQCHLDINEIYSRHLADLDIGSLPVGTGPDAQKASEDLKKKIEGLADEYSREAQSEQDRYDAETAHGRNEAKQRDTTAAIQARLGNHN